VGTVDWGRTMELLRGCPGQYPLLLELREVAGMEHPMAEIEKAFKYLETRDVPTNA
jgi:hypothetical protein